MVMYPRAPWAWHGRDATGDPSDAAPGVLCRCDGGACAVCCPRHLPAGVLYDLHVTAPAQAAKLAPAAGSGAGAGAGAGAGGGMPVHGSPDGVPQLPWHITAHFQSFPESVRLRATRLGSGTCV